MEQNFEAVKNLAKVGKGKLFGAGISDKDIRYLRGARENYERITGIKGEVEVSDDEGEKDVLGGSTPMLGAEESALVKKKKEKVPIYEKFAELEQDANLHNAMIEEIKAEDNVKIKDLKG